jgi:drug/metabolite transporter (DMT)-like permease
MAAGLGKFAALSMPHFSAAAVVSNHYYLLSILCLIVQAVCWPFVLRRYSLSFAYFYMSASYVGILLMSALVFHEPVTALNATGAALIIIGVNIVVRGRSEVHDHAT